MLLFVGNVMYVMYLNGYSTDVQIVCTCITWVLSTERIQNSEIVYLCFLLFLIEHSAESIPWYVSLAFVSHLNGFFHLF